MDRIARVCFPETFLISVGGIHKSLLSQILDFLPPDAKFIKVEVNHRSVVDEVYELFFISEYFDEHNRLHEVPEITPIIESVPNSDPTVTALIFHDALDEDLRMIGSTAYSLVSGPGGGVASNSWIPNQLSVGIDLGIDVTISTAKADDLDALAYSLGATGLASEKFIKCDCGTSSNAHHFTCTAHPANLEGDRR